MARVSRDAMVVGAAAVGAVALYYALVTVGVQTWLALGVAFLAGAFLPRYLLGHPPFA